MNICLSLIFILLSLSLTKLFSKVALNTNLMDIPNERSLHFKPVVRGSGLIFIGLSLFSLPILGYFTATPFQELFVLGLSIGLLAFIGFMDDLYSLSAKLRFLVQGMAALLVVLFLNSSPLNLIAFTIQPPLIVGVFLFFCTLWAINHFNFMDGLDGFCASQALFLLLTYSLLLHSPEAFVYHEFCLILSSCLLGFLYFNFPPAKIFMGDVGSATLGLITFVIAVIAQNKYQIPILYWFLLNGLFLFDATLTLIRRIARKEPFLAAHRKHAYQRLKQYGISAKVIVLCQWILNSLFLGMLLLFKQNLLSLGEFVVLELGALLSLYYYAERKKPMP